MRLIIPALLLLCLVGCNDNHGKPNTTQSNAGVVNTPASNASAGMPKSKQTTETPVHPWKPVPYDSTKATIEWNPRVPFFTNFEAKIKAAAKGEYETTKQYLARIADTNAIISPFSTSVSYAILPQYPELTYNADTQEYHSLFSGIDCMKHYPFKTGISCDFGSATVTKGNYVGQNAYGAIANVSSERGEDLYLVFPSSQLSKREFRGQTFDHKIPLSCHVPLRQAEMYKGKHIDAAIIIQLIRAQVLSSPVHFRVEDATIASPHQATFFPVGIPAKLEGSVCFVRETGKILGSRSYN